MATVPASAIMTHLTNQNPVYSAKIQELRDSIGGWLSYIPQTFPHYTRHTIQHSDEIISQLSNLLFKDGVSEKPIITLSATEIYILLVSAYLHDAGMVASDKEKLTILSSDEWKKWSSGDGSGAKRWNEIQEFRRIPAGDTALRDFLSDIQMRHLIADFVRRSHHERSASFITQHQAMLSRFAFDDPLMTRTVADVCLAHGLRQHALDDNERFPERRDVKGEKVNVRFMAILLRIGDLLDLSYDRACPLLLNAACPLPPESLAQWSQYQRITHRMTAPDRIEITAECETQEEHRFFLDWCQWLVDEIRDARHRMVRATRHNDWIPPRVDIGSATSSIVIRPSRTAHYIPSKWVFELDNDAVFDLVIKKTYTDSLAFIRELIQNALDATRCQMYADITADGEMPPEYPTQADEDRLNTYPLRIGLEKREVMNFLSGETEARQLLIIDDCGIGMDRDIIQRYFLQVGRSYYTTEEFQRSFHFVPTSRFGIGFLSVFSASDRVVVETFKPMSPHKDGPIRLTLTGPRNYLLTDSGDRSSCGTRVEVLLNKPLQIGMLTQTVSNWCRRVEFPIIVDDLGMKSTIEAEGPDQFIYEVPDVTEENAKFVLRSFPVNRIGIEGELYVLAHIGKMGESWAKADWARYTYPDMHPAATAPHIPHSLECLHGIAIGFPASTYERGDMIERVDWRRQSDPNLARDALIQHSSMDNIARELESRWTEILHEHLAAVQLSASNNIWKYKHMLARAYPLVSMWATVDEMIPIYMRSEQRYVSLSVVQKLPVLGITMTIDDFIAESEHTSYINTADTEPPWDSDVPFITAKTIAVFSDWYRRKIFVNRNISKVRWLNKDHIAIEWALTDNVELPMGNINRPYVLAEIGEPDLIGIQIHKTTGSVYETLVLNKTNRFIQWLVAIRDACLLGRCGLQNSQFVTLISLIDAPIRYRGYELDKLTAYVEKWRCLPGLEADLRPPVMEISTEMFFPARFRSTIDTLRSRSVAESVKKATQRRTPGRGRKKR